MIHHYSLKDMALFLAERWNDGGCIERNMTLEHEPPEPLPELSVLERLLSTCYYASLLQDEERSVRFRVILRAPDRFNPGDGPPTGFHRLIFTQPRPFNEQELKQLFPAADFYHSLIGVHLTREEELQIWGIINTGSRWVQNIYGGRQSFSLLPPSLVMCVTDPGRMTACRGSATVAVISGGEIRCPEREVFDTEWFLNGFAATRAELWNLHSAAREQAEEGWATLDQDMVRRIAQQVDRRVISMIRNSGHGGTLIFLPPEKVTEFSAENRYLTINYQFKEEEPRYRFRSLIVQILNVLAEECGTIQPSPKKAGWAEYIESRSEILAKLEEGILEVAHLIASFAAVDGAVVLANKYELLGYGAEISGELEKVTTVVRALDADGIKTEQKTAAGFGTRHRTVFRLCNALHCVMAIVVSQDRTVRFVKWKDGAVTYWDQVATSVLDI
jgi:hypothetical protein